MLDRPLLTLAMFVVPCLAIGVGIGQLQFESNYIRIFRGTSRVAQDYQYVEQRFGGIGLVELVAPAPRESQQDHRGVARLGA